MRTCHQKESSHQVHILNTSLHKKGNVSSSVRTGASHIPLLREKLYHTIFQVKSSFPSPTASPQHPHSSTATPQQVPGYKVFINSHTHTQHRGQCVHIVFMALPMLHRTQGNSLYNHSIHGNPFRASRNEKTIWESITITVFCFQRCFLETCLGQNSICFQVWDHICPV